MIKWIRTSGLSMKNSLSWGETESWTDERMCLSGWWMPKWNCSTMSGFTQYCTASDSSTCGGGLFLMSEVPLYFPNSVFSYERGTPVLPRLRVFL